MNAPSPFSDLTVVLRDVRGGLGLWCTRGVLGHALALLLWARLSGVSLRMERLAARFAAGRLWRRVGVAGIGVAKPGRVAGDGAAALAWSVRVVGSAGGLAGGGVRISASDDFREA